MSTKQVSCAAQVSLQEIQARKNKNNPLLNTPQGQYVGGTGVVAPIVPGVQKFPIPDTNARQINQKQPQQPLSIPNASLNDTAMQMNYPQAPTSGTGVAASMSDSAAKFAGGGGNQKIRVSQSGVLNTLLMIREPVVEYQETRGVPRNEEITFVTLVTSLCTQAYTAAITILVMLWNLMPLVDGLVYFVRFFLDKLIDIVKTPDTKDKAIKGAILFGELTVITFIIFMIVGLIFMPVYVLMARLFSKVFSMIAW